jgi:hypothetical protein
MIGGYSAYRAIAGQSLVAGFEQAACCEQPRENSNYQEADQEAQTALIFSLLAGFQQAFSRLSACPGDPTKKIDEDAGQQSDRPGAQPGPAP